MTWAWTVHLAPAPKLVLMALADEANDLGFCFPSHRHLAEKCDISERSVRRMIGLLAAQDHLSIQHRFSKHGGRTSNGYLLRWAPPRPNCPGGHGDSDRGDRTAVAGGPGQPWPGALDSSVRVTTTEPCIEPTPQPRCGDSTRALQGGGGELCFPAALSPAQRQALRRQLEAVNRPAAQQVLDELAGRMQAMQVRDPIRYCAGLIRRLAQGSFTAELGIAIAKHRCQPEETAEPATPAGEATAPATGNFGSALPEELRLRLERMRSKSES